MRLVWLLFFLCAADTILSAAGLALNLMEEANPIMHRLFKAGPGLFFTAKMSLPLVLLILRPAIYTRWVHAFINLAAAAYLAVNLMHLIWIFPVLQRVLSS